jgi:hypothetical protein
MVLVRHRLSPHAVRSGIGTPASRDSPDVEYRLTGGKGVPVKIRVAAVFPEELMRILIGSCMFLLPPVAGVPGAKSFEASCRPVEDAAWIMPEAQDEMTCQGDTRELRETQWSCDG